MVDDKGRADKVDSDGVSEEQTATDTGSNAGEKKSSGSNGKGTFTQADVDRIISKSFEKWNSDHEKEVAELEARAKQEALAEQGKYEELYKDTEAELTALKAEHARKQFREDADAALKQADLIEFSDIILQPRDKVAQVVKAAESLREILDKRVEAEVLKRIESGDRPHNTKPPNEKSVTGQKDWGQKISPEDWVEEKKRRGIYD